MGRSKRLIERKGSRDSSYRFCSPLPAQPWPRRSKLPNAKHEIPTLPPHQAFSRPVRYIDHAVCSALPSGKSRPTPVKVKLLLPPRQSRGISFVGLEKSLPPSHQDTKIHQEGRQFDLFFLGATLVTWCLGGSLFHVN